VGRAALVVSGEISCSISKPAHGPGPSRKKFRAGPGARHLPAGHVVIGGRRLGYTARDFGRWLPAPECTPNRAPGRGPIWCTFGRPTASRLHPFTQTPTAVAGVSAAEKCRTTSPKCRSRFRHFSVTQVTSWTRLTTPAWGSVEVSNGVVF
jgi:hypothetical protein